MGISNISNALYIPSMTESTYCEYCQIVARDKTDFMRHLSSKKHIQIYQDAMRRRRMRMDIENRVYPISSSKYFCEYCIYGTENKFNYEKHLKSVKHQKEKENQHSNVYSEKRCTGASELQNSHTDDPCNTNVLHVGHAVQEESSEPPPSSSDVTETSCLGFPIDTSLVMKLLLENQKLHAQLIEKDNLLEKMMLEQKEDIQKIIEKISNLKIEHSYTTNHITYHQTNIQVFLSEKCKNAVNMTEFLNSLAYSFESLEYVGKHGYVNGILKLIADRLNQMGIYERPFHCIDLKREVLYIKDDNLWEKDTPEIGKLKKMVNHVGDRNMKLIYKWQIEHPEIEQIDSSACDFYFQMIRESSNIGKKGERNDMKIVSKICEIVHVKQDNLL